MQYDSLRRGATWVFSCLRLGLLAAAVAASGGCYYLHLGSGQARLMLARDATADLVADPETPDRLREQLELVDRTRHFALELGLDVDQRYTSYVDWPGDRVVTTVVATRPGEVEARHFDFPIVGRVPYKGFFDRERAEDEARSLEAEGLDVCLVPVTAYSTLGWLDDPLTAPMLRHQDDTRLVETVLHELVHATVFVESQPGFNEGAARFIGQEAALRFFADDPARADEVAARVREDRRLAALLLGFRSEVEALYAREPRAKSRLEERARLEARFRETLADEPLATRDAAALAEGAALNDACLAIRGTYAADDGLHAELFDALGRDLVGLVERLREAAGAPDARAFFFEPISRGAFPHSQPRPRTGAARRPEPRE